MAALEQKAAAAPTTPRPRQVAREAAQAAPSSSAAGVASSSAPSSGARRDETPDCCADADGWAPFDEVQLANGIAAAAGWIDMGADPSLEMAGLSEVGWEELGCFEIVSDATDYVNTHGKVCRSAREVRARIQHAQRQFGTTAAALADFERDANRRAHSAEEAACAAAAASAAVPPAAAARRPAAARPIAVLPSAKRPCPNPFAKPFAAGPRAAGSLPTVHRLVPMPECLPPAVQCCFAPRAPLRAPPQRNSAATGGKARGGKQRRTQWSRREERALCGSTAKEPFDRSRPCGHPTAPEAHPLAQGRPLGPRGAPSPPK